MHYTARIVADSIAPHGVRLTTMDLRYPKIIHNELMTHRDFSRNASSSRAIPPARLIANVLEEPATPVFWGAEQRGMQARAGLTGGDLREAQALWRQGAKQAAKLQQELMDVGLHKQLANRVSEPWHHISVIVSATEWENFFALRCHRDAQPEIQALAWAMADAYHASRPRAVAEDEWHLPYVDATELGALGQETALKCSVARCARVSYNNHDGTAPDVDKDLALHDRLLAGLRSDDPTEPGHLSPFEHQGSPLASADMRCGNFRGWGQYRKTFKGERMGFDYVRACEASGRKPVILDDGVAG